MDRLTLVQNTAEQGTPESNKIWREQPVSPDWLFYGTDEVRRSGWFLRVTVTGMYPRRFGPFPSHHDAVEALEEFLAAIESGPLCELQNDLAGRGRLCVVEGIPILTGSAEQPPAVE